MGSVIFFTKITFLKSGNQAEKNETEKEVLLPITQLGKEDTHIILLSALGRSHDSTAKRNLSKDM